MFTRCIHESGEALCSHFCSHVGFAEGDLLTNRPERQERFTEMFGPLAPIEIIWLGNCTPEVQAELQRKNHELHERWLAEEAAEEEGVKS